eukprot:3267664-Pleurochrysis_carterae.AAC.1
MLCRAACNDKGTAHDNVDHAPIGCLALHVRAERANLKLARLVGAKRDDALELGDTASGKHLAENRHLAAQL